MRPPACLAFAGWICPGRLPPALRGAFAWRTDRATPSALRAGGRTACPQGLRRAARTGRSCCLRRNQPARPGPLPCCASGARTHPQFLWISRPSSVAILWCVWGMAACCRNRQCRGLPLARHRAAPGSASLRPLRGADGPCVSLPPSATSGLRAPLAGHWNWIGRGCACLARSVQAVTLPARGKLYITCDYAPPTLPGVRSRRSLSVGGPAFGPLNPRYANLPLNSRQRARLPPHARHARLRFSFPQAAGFPGPPAAGPRGGRTGALSACHAWSCAAVWFAAATAQGADAAGLAGGGTCAALRYRAAASPARPSWPSPPAGLGPAPPFAWHVALPLVRGLLRQCLRWLPRQGGVRAGCGCMA